MPALLPSELPVRARTRHHWVVLFRPPHELLALGEQHGLDPNGHITEPLPPVLPSHRFDRRDRRRDT